MTHDEDFIVANVGQPGEKARQWYAPNRYLAPNNLQEWLNSCVDEALIRLNVISLSGYQPYEYLCYGLPNSERRNDGRLRDKWLQRYSHTEEGGWWCSGIDVLTGEPAAWGQFKPDRPRCYRKKPQGFDPNPKIKTLKYAAPPTVSTEIYALRVPLEIWQKIAERHSVPMPDNLVVDPTTGYAAGFWQWVIDNPSIPVIVTEGAKKAGALITAEYVAIALPGINNGYRAPKDEFGNLIKLPYLIPQLKAFAVPGREIIFGFDKDKSFKTIKDSRRAIIKTGKLLAKEGCTVKVISWKYPEKGVDDLIAVRGLECFKEAYRKRKSLAQFQISELLDLGDYVSERVNEEFLPEGLTPPDSAQIIGLKSAKGTGKTEWLMRKVEKAIPLGQRVLVITHRIQLAKALCCRFQIEHIEEIRESSTGGILGYGLCIDSLHPKSMARFNPEEWSEGLVILDECEQIIWHMLNSNTCIKNRVPILENFSELLNIITESGGKIYISDADLSRIAIDYVKQLIREPVELWVGENTFNPILGKRKLFVYSGADPLSLVNKLIEAIAKGEKVLIHVSAQKNRHKWGTIQLEKYIFDKFPQLKILRIDGESVADPEHAAYNCMGKLNTIVPNFEVVIASPTIETGVSIDVKGHFNSVWGIATGVQSTDAVCQTLERCREHVPRHLWARKTGTNRVGNGSYHLKSLLKSQHQITRANMQLLQIAGVGDDVEYVDFDYQKAHLITWAKRACVINLGMSNYREEIVEKLVDSGYELVSLSETEEERESRQKLKQEMTSSRDQNYREYCEQVSQQSQPSEEKLEELENKKAKTETERLMERKGKLSKRYGVEVTPELVEKDDRGWFPKLQLHFYLTLGNKYLAQRDKRSLNKLTELSNGKAFKPDVNKSLISIKIEALKKIGIEQFFDPHAEFSSQSLKEWFDKLNNPLTRGQIKTIFGTTIHPEKDTPIGVAQRFLAMLDLKLEFKWWRGGRKNKHRIYSGCNVNPDGRDKVFEMWLSQDEQLYPDFSQEKGEQVASS